MLLHLAVFLFLFVFVFILGSFCFLLSFFKNILFHVAFFLKQSLVLCPFLIVTVKLMIFLFQELLWLLFIFSIHFKIITVVWYFLFAQFFIKLILFFLILFTQEVYNVLTIINDTEKLLFFLIVFLVLFLIFELLIILSLNVF